jgi:hypothetical protein
MKRHKETNDAAEWLGRICLLNVSKTAERGHAPHKPLLLLCIMDMIEDGAITTQWIPYSPELFFRFHCYLAIVYPISAMLQPVSATSLADARTGSSIEQAWEHGTEVKTAIKTILGFG